MKQHRNPVPGQLDATKEVENGFYQVTLLKEGKVKIMLAADKTVAEKVLSQTTMQLLLIESNVIVDVVS